MNNSVSLFWQNSMQTINKLKYSKAIQLFYLVESIWCNNGMNKGICKIMQKSAFLLFHSNMNQYCRWKYHSLLTCYASNYPVFMIELMIYIRCFVTYTFTCDAWMCALTILIRVSIQHTLFIYFKLYV